MKQALVDQLVAARRRSLDLLSPLADDDLMRQHSPIMSPLAWDLAHVGNYEELWLLRSVSGAEPIDPRLDDMYDAFRHPRPNRPALPLLHPADARRYIGEVRSRALDILDGVELEDPARPLVDGGFVYGMVIQHEYQHDETMLATLQLMEGEGYRPLAPAPRGPGPGDRWPEEVLVPAGPFVMGSDDHATTYDNERPAHTVDVAAFWIDTTPVSNRRFAEFVDDGGYQDRRWWSQEGWEWRQGADLCAAGDGAAPAPGSGEGHRHPGFWWRDGGGWARRRFGWIEPLPLDEPVQHVCWHEASAFSRWAGKRLPTEAEWEKAASWAPEGGKRSLPWASGRSGSTAVHDTALLPASLGGRLFRPAPVGSYPEGASAYGCRQMLGDVWEWTSSEFEAYPGFTSFPYREYSEVFFGSGYRVLRGGSWATDPSAVRTTFRNWDHPIRRQIFAGFRCARDAG